MSKQEEAAQHFRQQLTALLQSLQAVHSSSQAFAEDIRQLSKCTDGAASSYPYLTNYIKAWFQQFSPFQADVSSRNDNIFTRTDIPFLNRTELNRMWTQGLFSNVSKKHLWTYIQELCDAASVFCTGEIPTTNTPGSTAVAAEASEEDAKAQFKEEAMSKLVVFLALLPEPLQLKIQSKVDIFMGEQSLGVKESLLLLRDLMLSLTVNDVAAIMKVIDPGLVHRAIQTAANNAEGAISKLEPFLEMFAGNAENGGLGSTLASFMGGGDDADGSPDFSQLANMQNIGELASLLQGMGAPAD